MKITYGFYWQQDGSNATALVLQEIRCTRDGTPILLGCVCTVPQVAEGGFYLTRQLLEWFYSMPWVEYRMGGNRELDVVEASLKQCIQRTDNELAHYSGEGCPGALSGILCMGSSFLLFNRGSQTAHLLNRRFSRGNMRPLAGGEKLLTIHRGSMQKNLGILLASASLTENLTQEEVRDCLVLGVISSTEQINRRLRELGEAAKQRGAVNPCAILIRV